VFFVQKVKVTSKGQITLPQNMRDKLNIKKGDYLDIAVQKNTLVLEPAQKNNHAEMLMEYCEKYSAEKASLEEARKVLSKVPFSLSDRTIELREEADEE
jgi:AbrB family looped-hinge helix DNA binding protein